MSKVVVVAIDGPAGAGKSTVARTVAERLGYVYINTGAMYRAVALWALRLGFDLQEHLKLQQLAEQARIEFQPASTRVFLNGEDITEALADPAVSDAASIVSAVPGVRRALVAEQRRIAEGASVVMEGRDIGTVVFPDADVKLYLDASPEERARRRANDPAHTGVPAAVSDVATLLTQRDEIDRTRAVSPLYAAADAIVVDTTGKDVDTVVREVLGVVREKRLGAPNA